MLCEGCGEQMQRETIVLVTRMRGRTRSIMQPGWYCWTCKTSVHSASDMMEPADPARGRPAPRDWRGGARSATVTEAGVAAR